MRFKFIIEKWANFYFFVQNLSEWHFSNLKPYNEYWEKELGTFSEKEEKALEKFAGIHLQHPFEEQYLGESFLLQKEPWKTLKRRVSKEELEGLKKTFSIWKPKFESLWEKELPLLKKWQQKLKARANDKMLIKKMNEKLSSLYQAPFLQMNINVFLLFSSPSYCGGDVYVNKSLGLQISQYPLEKFNHALNIIWHELIHFYFEKFHFLPLLKKKVPNDQKAIFFIKEAAASSLLPSGVLEESTSKTDKFSLHTLIPPKYNNFLLGLMNEYIKKNKSLDTHYIESVLSIVPKLKKAHSIE